MVCVCVNFRLKILENFHLSRVIDKSMNNLSAESSTFFSLTQALRELTYGLGQQVQEEVYDLALQ